MKNALLDKIQQVLQYFTGNRADQSQVGVIENWMDEAKRLLLIDHIAQFDGTKYVREVFENEVESINSTLQNSYSKDLPDLERDRLLDRRELARKYLDLFSETEERLAKIEEDVDNEMGN